MLLAAAILITSGALLYTLLIRPEDLPEPAPLSPFQHLDEQRARIYDNLRDLQFEYRVGKLSDEDYQKTKSELQGELARVMAEIDKVKATLPPGTAGPTPVAAKTAPVKAKPSEHVCQSCGARFATAMNFCGSCGKAMGGAA